MAWEPGLVELTDMYVRPLLQPGEEIVYAARGTNPSSLTGDKAFGMATGIGGQYRANQRQPADAGDRLLVLTTANVYVLDRGTVVDHAPLFRVTGVELKNAFSNTFRRVLSVDVGNRRLRIEGEQARLESLQAAIATTAGVALSRQPGCWVLRAAVPGFFFAFAGIFVLVAIADTDPGSIVGAIVCGAIGELFRRLLLRKKEVRAASG